MNDVRVFNTHPNYRVRVKDTIDLARFVCKKEKNGTLELNIVIVNDRDMKALNGAFLNHWYRTDVLSFPLESERKKVTEGEIYINIDQARRQALEYRVSVKKEVSRLVIHGVLHLLGYEDVTRKQKQRMTDLENRYLQYL